MSPYSPSLHPSPAVQLSERRALGKGKRYRAYLKNQAQGQGFCCCCCYSLCFSFSEKESICSPSPEMVRLQLGRALWCTLTNKMWWKGDFQDKALGGLAAFALSLFLPWDHQVIRLACLKTKDHLETEAKLTATTARCYIETIWSIQPPPSHQLAAVTWVRSAEAPLSQAKPELPTPGMMS